VRNPFSILTKGTLILRDIDRLADAASVMDVSTAFSIGTLDEGVWRTSEPGTPHPRKRVEAVRKLNEAGIPCGVLIAPVLPGLSDSKAQLREVVTACIDAGATHVSPILLHLRPKVREVYMEWLGETYPELVPMYEEKYTRAYASRSDQQALSRKVAEVAAEHPKPRPHRPLRGRRPPRDLRKDVAALKNEQMSLL
jgi:DNA repair photolyase